MTWTKAHTSWRGANLGPEMTLDQLFVRAAEQHTNKRFNFPQDDLSVEYGALFERSDRIAAGLQAAGYGHGHVAGLLGPTGCELVEALFAILRSGATLAPLPLPVSLRQLREYGERLTRIVEAGRLSCIVACARTKRLLQSAGVTLQVPILTVDDIPRAKHVSAQRTRPQDAAILQYTSGSTSTPKGVSLTHRNVVAGLEAILNGICLSSDDINGQWLPLYHDMGLIGMLAGTIAGVDHYLWSPSAFIRAPHSWLEAFAARRATIYAGPSFSFERMLARARTSGFHGDLSHWRIAFNGAEPIASQIVRDFCGFFDTFGFDARAMFPVYGLAEATLAVTFPKLGTPPRALAVDSSSLGEGAAVRLAAEAGPRRRELVATGSPVKGLELRIAHTAGTPSTERRVGQIEVRGTSVMTGYAGHTREQSGFCAQGWLATGDLGFLDDGDLFVCGRTKEVIVVHGSNVYPQDVETAVSQLAGVHQGECVAFSNGSDERDGLVVLVETGLEEPDAKQELIRRAQAHVLAAVGTSAVQVCLVAPRAIEKTSSGKYRRLSMRQRFLAGEFAPAHDTIG